MRSSWKGNYFKFNKKYASKSSIIPVNFFHRKFFLYDGREMKSFLVEKQQLRHRFGEFLFTRKVGVVHKKKINKKQIKQKKK